MPRRYGSTSEEEHLLDVARCDHYSHDDDNDDDAAYDLYDRGGGLTPVTGGRRKKKRGTSTSNNNNCSIIGCCKTFTSFLLLPLLLLTAISLFYSYRLQHQLTSLSDQLQSATSNIATLANNLTMQSHQLLLMNATVANHSGVISRFEHSVSNSDVLQKLEQLEEDSKEREERVEQEMDTTKSEIRGVLTKTKAEIDETVSDATNQINSQVLKVQSTLSSYIRTTQDQFSTENSFMIYQLAGTITLIGCLISMWHMTSHLRNFHQPFVQRKILAILWMCPIYSVTSWLSLVMPQLEGYLAILKDLYEAYVIYQFLSFCIAVLGKGDRNAVVELLAKHADHLSPPVRCCFGCCRKSKGGDNGLECEDEKRQLADDVLLQCQLCAMQFVFLRPLLTATLFVLKKVDYHGPMFGPGSPFDHSDGLREVDDDFGDEGGGGRGGIMDYRSPQFYIIILENVSVFLAFSGLLKFYHAVQEDLSWCRPFPKFLCIKGVVFMTFWQGIGISLLANTTDLLSNGGEAVSTGDGDDEDQVETWAKQAQNFLICLEMLGFAIAHFYCFPVEEWKEGYRPVEDKGKFGDNMALGDFLHDLKLILRHNEKKKRLAKEKSGIKPSDDSISTVLEEDEELGQTDSNEDGLQSLLGNVEDLLESTGDADSITADDGRREKLTPRTYRKSIQQSLESMDAPTELRQATALLLQSTLLDETTARLLTTDILDQPLEVGDGSLDEKDGEGEVHVDIDEDAVGGEESKQSPEDVAGCEEADGVDCVDSLTGHDAPASLQPLESTLLLAASSNNDDMLRPSIFTMHSMSPEEE
ncbi:hypothetical protein ACHAXR_009488 [Thalassiosira sp. AJA248-18]